MIKKTLDEWYIETNQSNVDHWKLDENGFVCIDWESLDNSYNKYLQEERDKKLTDLLGPEPVKVPSNYDQAMEHMRWLKTIYKDEDIEKWK